MFINWRGVTIVLSLSIVAPQAVTAATTATPNAREEIERFGNSYSADRIPELRAIYKVYLRAAGFETPDVVRDVRYGPHERHRLDVLMPRDPPRRAMPVLVFVHGGAFVGGNKSDGEIFDNVLSYFTRRGVLGINATYRLAPRHRWPAGAEDVRDVVDWIRANAAEYGGDPDKIFLMGHSAGAVHVATYTFMEELQADGGDDGLRGSILLSGIYGADPEYSRPEYYGDDPSRRQERMPLRHIDGRRVPLFIIDAEYDRTATQKEAIALIEAICDRDDKCPRHGQVPGHNHYSMMYHFNTKDESIARDILDFIIDLSRDGS